MLTLTASPLFTHTSIPQHTHTVLLLAKLWSQLFVAAAAKKKNYQFNFVTQLPLTAAV